MMVVLVIKLPYTLYKLEFWSFASGISALIKARHKSLLNVLEIEEDVDEKNCCLNFSFLFLFSLCLLVCKCCVTWNRCSNAMAFSQIEQYKILPSLCKCSSGNSETYFADLDVLDYRTLGIITQSD